MNTLRSHANRCRVPRRILRVAYFVALATLLSANGRTITAQDQPSAKTKKTAEARRVEPGNLDDPQSTENRVKQILALKDRLLQLSEGEQNDKTKAEIAGLVDAIARAGASAQTWQSAEKTPEQRAQVQQLQQMKEMLADREKQMAMLAKQMSEQQRRPPLPPLENGQVKVYAMKYIAAREVAQTIELLFGSALRISVDERGNALIVYGRPDSFTALDALVERLDRQAAPANPADKSAQSAAAPRSILLRVFWLADNLPESVGQTPFNYLPESVIEATTRLGLQGPRLVTQTVNSLALSREDAADFSTSVPALLFEQEVGLTCQGKIKLISDDRVRLEMGVHVGGPTLNCEINGSLATPLGHYMVLGTANSVMTEGGTAAGEMGRGPGGMAPGMGPGAGPEGGGFGGAAGRPFVGRVNPNQAPGIGGPEGAPAAGAGPGGEAGGPGMGDQRAKPNFNASRFAFVVQVIEGQSYPAEKEKDGRKSLPSRPTK